jgi:phosphoglycerate dehydrogenase-like enzyme
MTSLTRLALPSRFRDALQELPRELQVNWYGDSDQCMSAVKDADMLWHDPRTAGPPRDLLPLGEHLAWVFCHNVGVDRMPLGLFAERHMALTNGAGLYAIPIAEYAVMAMLAAAKGLPELLQAQQRGEWLALAPRFIELSGTTALIIGYGHIGRAIKERLDAFGVVCTGVRRRPSGEPDVIGLKDWRSRLGEFDWVIICAPLTSETDRLISAAELAAMKKSAWVLNISRGQVVDTGALQAALTAGRIGGAYLDVTDPEPLPADSRLWKLPNVILTPHTSFASPHFMRRAAQLFLDNLARFRSGLPLRNLVDLDAGY